MCVFIEDDAVGWLCVGVASRLGMGRRGLGGLLNMRRWKDAG
jgi:hypothetical protein